MKKVFQFAEKSADAQLTLTLPYDQRIKARFIATLDNAEEVGIQIERGKTLRGGDKLQLETGEVIAIISAPEQVSTVKLDDLHLLARICYHLGNRHVPLQIQDNYCRYQKDHVLDDMVIGLGGSVIHESAAFEPESGAYHSHHSSNDNAGSGHAHSGHSQSGGHHHSH